MKNIILFGSGYMAEEYLKVLSHLRCRVVLIGRDLYKARQLASRYGSSGLGGGIEALDGVDIKKVDLVIIASAVESLCDIGLACIKKGFKNILLEKPGALNLSELKKIERNSKGINMHIAYNRRFYGSVMKLKEKICRDGGALGCFFDFTEREQAVLNSHKPQEVLGRWGFVNSSHVIDTVFYLIGSPVELNCLRSGAWPCHRSGNVFAGSGKTKKCLFSYFAAWAGGGRWNIEVSTLKGRYRLLPLEELYFCKKNQFVWEGVSFDENDDKRFKPGLYKMVKAVLRGAEGNNLPDLSQQIELCKTVNRILGYKD